MVCSNVFIGRMTYVVCSNVILQGVCGVFS